MTLFINRTGLRWRDAPAAYGPSKTALQQMGALEPAGGGFARIFTELATEGQEVATVMMDVEPLARASEGPSHRVQPAAQKGGAKRFIGRTKGGLNSKQHGVTDARGRPVGMYPSAGQTSDYIGARALLSARPKAGDLLADRGYDADWLRNALIEPDIQPCIPSRRGRKTAIPHDPELYRKRHKIENMFARLKDWRRIATRYNRCADLFLSACDLTATVMFWLCVLILGVDPVAR